MHKRKLKHVADITSRQFCRRVYTAVIETINKAKYMSCRESKNFSIAINYEYLLCVPLIIIIICRQNYYK